MISNNFVLTNLRLYTLARPLVITKTNQRVVEFRYCFSTTSDTNNGKILIIFTSTQEISVK